MEVFLYLFFLGIQEELGLVWQEGVFFCFYSFFQFCLEKGRESRGLVQEVWVYNRYFQGKRIVDLRFLFFIVVIGDFSVDYDNDNNDRRRVVMGVVWFRVLENLVLSVSLVMGEFNDQQKLFFFFEFQYFDLKIEDNNFNFIGLL